MNFHEGTSYLDRGYDDGFYTAKTEADNETVTLREVPHGFVWELAKLMHFSYDWKFWRAWGKVALLSICRYFLFEDDEE